MNRWRNGNTRLIKKISIHRTEVDAKPACAFAVASHDPRGHAGVGPEDESEGLSTENAAWARFEAIGTIVEETGTIGPPASIAASRIAKPNAAAAMDRWQAAYDAGFDTGDWAAMRALCAPGMVMDDRRLLALISGDRDLLLAAMPRPFASISVTPSWSTAKSAPGLPPRQLQRRRRSRRRGSVRSKRTRPGSKPVALDAIYVCVGLGRGERPVGLEIFELDDLDAARARFEDLSVASTT